MAGWFLRYKPEKINDTNNFTSMLNKVIREKYLCHSFLEYNLKKEVVKEYLQPQKSY
jgi:hypothetical protein